MRPNRTRCAGCPYLEGSFVKGSGTVGRLMIIGEAAGEMEAKKGTPFVGDSGKLLKDTLRACGIDLDDCYFTNAVGCRPPGNETPTAAMVNSCRGDLLKEIIAVRPEKILAVGAVALQALSGTAKSTGIVKSHGLGQMATIDPGNGFPFDVYLLATYHSSFVLRNDDSFRSFAFDIEKWARNSEPLPQPEILIEEVYE